MDSTTLSENCQDWNQNISVDESKRLVKNVALTGGKSRNGYTYRDSALKNAVHLYEGKPVFLDHARDRSRPQDRSTRDLVGSITQPSFSEGRIRGDIRVLDTESGQTFLKLLEIEAPGVGMSHVVRAQRSSDGKMIDEIADVISVDVVINPATTLTFNESFDSEADVRQQITALQEQITSLNSTNEQLQLEKRELTSQFASLRCKQRVRDLLAESLLPDQAITDFFVKQLESTKDDQTRQRMIQDRLSLISAQSSRPTLVQSQERKTHSESLQTDNHFVNAIRRS